MSNERQRHTPGPWTHDEAQDFRICVFTEGPEDPICDVRCHDGSSSGEHGEANARLIAAAPDLYSALQLMLEKFQDGVRPGEAGWDAIEAARSAIFRVEGK